MPFFPPFTRQNLWHNERKGHKMKKITAICLTLCMILSSFVFALPASAQDGIIVETDYSSYLDADDSYIINPEWSDEITDSTAEGTELSSFFFNGKMRTVKYQKGRHFADYDDAFEAVFCSGNIDETNYFDVDPTFIFAPALIPST